MTEHSPNDQFRASAFLDGANADYIDQLQARYAADPAAFATIQETGRKTFIGYMEQIDARLAGRDWFLDTYSVIEVYAPDQPGQLYHIAQAMADFGLNIHKAYIATESTQLIDVFYVLDSQGNKLVDDDFSREVTQGILHSLSRAA